MRANHAVGTTIVAAMLSVAASACGSTVPLSTDGAATTAGQGLAVPGGPASAAGGSQPPASAGLATPGTAGPAAQPSSGISGSQAPGTVVPSKGTAQTGPADHGPLTVGITYLDNSQVNVGYTDPRTVTTQNVVSGYVKAINATGGFGGRKVVPVYYKFNIDSNDWAGQAAAACQQFTADHHVTVVLDNAFGSVGGFRDCLQKHGVFDITDAWEGDDVSSGQASLHVNVLDMTVDATYGSVVDRTVAAGYLSKSNQLGIIVEDCPEDTRALSRTIEPLIGHFGLKAPQVQSINCAAGINDAGPDGAQISNAVLKFRSAGVDRVMIVSWNETTALLFFSQGAHSQGYKPTYLLSSNAQAHLTVESNSNFPADQLPQVRGAGYSPYSDVNGAAPSTTDARCLHLLKSVGIVPQNYDDTDTAVGLCGPFLMLDTALHQTVGNASASTLASTVAAMGTNFSAPAVLASQTRFSSSRHFGPTTVRAFAYQSGCGCIRYTQASASTPE